MCRAVNVFVSVRFQMVIAMIPYPCHRVAGQRHRRARCEHKFEPFRHFKPPMGQIAMQIKRCANSAPKKEHKHNRQIGDLETRQESDESEQLQDDQDNEKEEIESFVLKHAAERDEDEAANRAADKSKRVDCRTTGGL